MIGGENQSNGDHPLSNGGQPISGDPPFSLPRPNHHPLSHPLETPTIATSSPSAADEFDPSDLLTPNSDYPTSFHNINDSNSNAHDQSDSSPDPPDYIRISVSNPQKVPEASNSIVPGSNSYYTYRITTTTNVPEFGGSEFRVRRRFRDVVALSDRLSERYRGFFVPLRPDKGVIEGQVMEKTEFVEQRRAAIEKYLRKLAAHPVLRKGKELRDFLAAEDEGFSAASSSTPFSDEAGAVVGVPREAVGKGGGGGRDWWRVFREVKQSVVNEWGGSKPPVTEEDKEFLERKKRLEEIGVQLSSVTQQAEGLVTAQQELGQTMGELGLMFMKLVKFENQEAVLESQRRRAADMKNVATATIKASRLYRSLNDKTASHLDVLHDYLGMMLAADHAFAERSSALLNVQTLASELSSLQFKIEKLEISSSKIFGGDRSTLLKIEEMKETAKTTEDAKHSAIKEYDQIKENNKAELHRLDKDRRSDFWNMMRGFVVSQAEYAESMASVWEKLAEDTYSEALN